MLQKEQLYYLLIILFTFFLYGNTLFNGYSLDDELVIKDNLKVHQGIKGIPEIFTTHYSSLGDVKFEYRPVVLTTFALEFSLWGENPFLSHLINIILYAILLFVLFKVLQRSFSDFSTLFVFLLVLLYATHPIHTEVVASLKNRDELLSSLFGFLFIYYVFKYMDRQKIINFILAILFLILGVLSKKSAILFPFFLFLFLYFFAKISWKKMVVFFGISLLLLLVSYYSIRHLIVTENADRMMWFIENPLVEYKGIFIRLLALLYSLLFYFKLTLFPHPLLFYYGYNMIPITEKISWEIIIIGIFLLFLLYLSLKGLKKKSKLSFGILFFLLGISIYTNFFKMVPGIVGVRFLHVAVLGYAIVLMIVLSKLFKFDKKTTSLGMKSNTLFVIVLFSIIGLYSFKTIDKNLDWKSKLSLFEHDIKYLNESVKANDLLGNEYLIQAESLKQKKDFFRAQSLAQKAKTCFIRAISIYSNDHKAKSNLGYLYLNYFGKPDSAYFYFNQIHSEKKKKILSLFSQANEVLNKNDTATAIELFSEILHKDSTYIEAYTPLSKIYFKQGNLKKAVDLNRILIRKGLGLDLPFINIANFYYLSGDIMQGIAFAELALKKNPNNVKVCNKISEYYYQKGNIQKGKHYYKMAKRASEKDSLFKVITEKK